MVQALSIRWSRIEEIFSHLFLSHRKNWRCQMPLVNETPHVVLRNGRYNPPTLLWWLLVLVSSLLRCMVFVVVVVVVVAVARVHDVGVGVGAVVVVIGVLSENLMGLGF